METQRRHSITPKATGSCFRCLLHGFPAPKDIFSSLDLHEVPTDVLDTQDGVCEGFSAFCCAPTPLCMHTYRLHITIALQAVWFDGVIRADDLKYVATRLLLIDVRVSAYSLSRNSFTMKRGVQQIAFLYKGRPRLTVCVPRSGYTTKGALQSWGKALAEETCPSHPHAPRQRPCDGQISQHIVNFVVYNGC